MVQVFDATMPAAVSPCLLRADNFASSTRTPWGGTHIISHYKRAWLRPDQIGCRVGESWELSVGELGSADLADVSLRDRIAADPRAWLGAEAERGATTSLLVKLMDTADDLSVQLHPFDDDPALAVDEAGKEEAWLVVRADPGAVIHLGLRQGVTEAQMRSVLASGGDASSLLRRWPAEPGDFYLVQPGTPHAVGRGITLVEPQTATAGKRAMTYRYWDWNRRYNAQGVLDPSGSPRELHVERALAATRWPGLAPIDPPHTRIGEAQRHAEARWQPLCGPEQAPCRSSALRVGRLAGQGMLALPDWNVLRALTVLEGRITLDDGGTPLTIAAGQTAALPACATKLQAQLDAAHAVISAIAV